MQEPIGTVHVLPSTQGTTNVVSVPVKISYARFRSYQAICGVSFGQGTAIAQFYGSAVLKPKTPTATDLSDWVTIGNAITLAPNASTQSWLSDGFTNQDSWLWVCVLFTSITGTNVQVGAWVSG